MKRVFLIAVTPLLAIGLALFFPQTRMVAEKVLTALAMPYGMAWLLSAAACLVAASKKERGIWGLCLTVCLVLYLGGNGWVAKWSMRSLEMEFVTADPFAGDDDALATIDTVVLLGGGTGVRPGGTAELGLAGDRLFMAAELYHAGRIRRIVCTGSRITALDRGGRDPHETARELLQRVGVPADSIETVPGRTTSEEMQALAQRLPPNETVGIVTSAWHMRRALRLAENAGLAVIPVPADFRSPSDMRPTVMDFVPDTYAAETIRLACKEWLARVVQR